MQSTFLSSNPPGAAGARLLSGQSKPVAMDVDEEENMSESAQIFSFVRLSVRVPVCAVHLNVCLYFCFPSFCPPACLPFYVPLSSSAV